MTQETQKTEAEMTEEDREVHELVNQLFGRLDELADELFD